MFGGFQPLAFQPAYQQQSGTPAVPDHFVWGPFIHGSHLTLSQKLKKKVPDEVLTIIEEVVTPTLASTNLPQEARLTLQQSETLLRAELKAQNILWKVAYRDALIELRNQQNEEETVVMMLFAM